MLQNLVIWSCGSVLTARSCRSGDRFRPVLPRTSRSVRSPASRGQFRYAAAFEGL